MTRCRKQEMRAAASGRLQYLQAMDPIDLLMHEHEVIQRGLALLLGVSTRLRAGENVSQNGTSALLDFFARFADGRHHLKEEQALFPAMADAGLPMHGGPLAVMLHEHEIGRSLLHDMSTVLPDLPAPKARDAFCAAADQYVANLSAHIEKENGVLFRMARQMIPPEQLRECAARFDALEAQFSAWLPEQLLEEAKKQTAQ